MTQSSRGTKRWRYLEFHHLYHSNPAVVFEPECVLQVGPTSSLELVSVFLAVAANENVNKPLRLESMM